MFTIEEVVEYLHMPRAEIEELVHHGEIPVEKRGDKLVFRKKDIDAWASQRILGLSGGGLAAYHKKTSAKAHDLSRHHAIIAELMKPDYVESALTSKTRASILRDMVKLADRTGLLYDAKALLKSVDERERLCSTALSGGIALLHAKNQDPYLFEDSFIIAGRTIQPIPFGSPDGSTTDLFFMICCQDDRIHLHVLARICMMCHHTSMLLEMREAPDAASMHRVIVDSEAEIIQSLR